MMNNKRRRFITNRLMPDSARERKAGNLEARRLSQRRLVRMIPAAG
jgi:hypothetical protein